MVRPPPLSGKYLRHEILALRRVIDSLDTTRPFQKNDPRERARVFDSIGKIDDFERVYGWLYAAAKAGLTKQEAASVAWANISTGTGRVFLPDGSFVVIDDQSVQDIKNIKARYPYPLPGNNMVMAAVGANRINARVMERWACRADLTRLDVRFENLVAGFAALYPTAQRRFKLCP